jgi:predicted NUDIX family NTP pyrophosphohydrolase
MAKKSAGLLMYRKREGQLEILLVHPGGPFWAKKDEGAWSIPKGRYIEEENALEAAKREFKEETGLTAAGDFKQLKSVVLRGGKEITAWAFEGDCNVSQCQSNTFLMEWPPFSGNQQEFPEVDRAKWFTIEQARIKILKGQIPLLEDFEQLIKL